jgi:glycine cleavage system aminomethyltransferase T
MAKQSALHHWAAQAGASFTEHHGWQTPARFTNAREEAAQVVQSAGLADVSWTAKFDLQGHATVGEGFRRWTLGPRHLLVTCDPSTPVNVAGGLTTDVTSVFAQFVLAGRRSRDILAKLTSLNVSESVFPNHECRQTSLAHVHATVLRQDLQALPAFHLLVARDSGESVWEAVLHAGHEFQMVPFGLDALAILEAEG